MDFSKLERLKKIKKLSYEELAEMIGMSKNGLNLAIKNKDLKISVLEKIAAILGVSVTYFFDDSSKNTVMEPTETYGKTTNCQNCIRLEKVIDNQNSYIEFLEKKCGEQNKKAAS